IPFSRVALNHHPATCGHLRPGRVASQSIISRPTLTTITGTIMLFPHETSGPAVCTSEALHTSRALFIGRLAPDGQTRLRKTRGAFAVNASRKSHQFGDSTAIHAMPASPDDDSVNGAPETARIPRGWTSSLSAT